jgi:hypothetical protein
MQFHRHGDEWYFLAHIEIPRAWDALFRCPGEDYSDLTKTRGGHQWRPSYGSDLESTLRKTINPCLRQQGLSEVKQRWDWWMIDYEPQGYQEFHAHGRGLITQILYFTDDASCTELEIGGETLSFPSRRGQLLTMSGATKHRGTAVEDHKRVFVIDWVTSDYV